MFVFEDLMDKVTDCNVSYHTRPLRVSWNHIISLLFDISAWSSNVFQMSDVQIPVSTLFTKPSLLIFLINRIKDSCAQVMS